MYRIELRSGEETVFRTIEELATGIRNGLVTPRARIFHNASQKWLPIEFHPHYKKALAMPATKSGETPAVAPAPAPTGGLTFIALGPEPAPARASHASPVAVAAPTVETAAPLAAVTSPVVDLPTIAYTESTSGHVPHPVAHAPVGRGPLGRPRALRLGVAAAVVIVAAYMVLSAAKPTPRAAADPAPIAAPNAEPAVEQPTPVEQVAEGAAQNTGGPTFGGSPAPVAPKRPIITSIGATPPTPPATSDSAAIQPPPVGVDLSIPSLPKGDSLAPSVANDSNAMRRILRAVGGKATPAAPTQP